MNITLRQLRAFVAVAKAGSFTAAASRLHLTQSALSGLVRELELSLGVELVHRTTRAVQLSPVGAEFLPLTERLLDDLERALGSISDLKSLNTGLVRVAAPQLMACTLLPQAIAKFRQSYPNVDIAVVDCQVEEVGARVLSGEVDLGIGPERAQSEGLENEFLFEMPFLAVMPKGHPLCAKTEVSWQELMAYPVISLRGDYSRMLNNDLIRFREGAGFKPFAEVAFMTTALSMASAGLGVTTCLPYAQSLVTMFGLDSRRLVDPVISRSFQTCRRRGRTLGPAPARFVEFLNEHVNAPPAS